MKYFLDSAKMDEIEEAYGTFGIDGVTTNPNHIMNSGKPFMTALNDMASWVKKEGIDGYEKFPISVEVNPHITDPKVLQEEAEKIAKISPNFVIKIPCTVSGITAARKLEAEGIRTNVTLVFSASQALLPGKIGAKFVSPFIGWKESNGEDCREYIDDIVGIYQNYGWYGKTEIICAAIRTGKQFVDCAVSGADIVTAGLSVFKDSIYHPYTDFGINKFCNAWDKTAKE